MRIGIIKEKMSKMTKRNNVLAGYLITITVIVVIVIVALILNQIAMAIGILVGNNMALWVELIKSRKKYWDLMEVDDD